MDYLAKGTRYRRYYIDIALSFLIINAEIIFIAFKINTENLY